MVAKLTICIPRLCGDILDNSEDDNDLDGGVDDTEVGLVTEALGSVSPTVGDEVVEDEFDDDAWEESISDDEAGCDHEMENAMTAVTSLSSAPESTNICTP